jgi:hypothetical protein
MMPQVPNTSALVSVPEVALPEILIQMSGFGGERLSGSGLLTEGRF